MSQFEEEPATQEEAESSFEPATQEDPPATQEDPASAPGYGHASSSDDDDGLVANDENGAPSTGSSSGPLTVSWAHEPPKRRRSEPSMARRAEVSWHTKLSRTISIDRLPQEGKRMNHPFLTRQPSEIAVPNTYRRGIAALANRRPRHPGRTVGEIEHGVGIAKGRAYAPSSFSAPS